MNMIVHKLPFSLLKNIIVGINNNTCNNNNDNDNNKVKDKYNCYDYDYKLNTIRKQRSLNHYVDHSQIKAN